MKTENKDMKITDDTIMPDGRPFYAWKNEVGFLREAARNLQPERERLSDMMRLLKIAKIESERQPWTGDLLIRFRMIDQVNSLSKDDMKYTRDQSL